jgi:hypothetical protein
MPSDDFIPTTCKQCNRGFNVANPWVQLEPPCAICPHCGQRTMVDEKTMERAKDARGVT